MQNDAGSYCCKIVNKKGSDFTKGVLLMRTKRNVILDPQVPENMSLESIRKLENRHVVEKQIAEEPVYPPKFLKPIESLNINESSIAHFETRECWFDSNRLNRFAATVLHLFEIKLIEQIFQD